MPTVGVFAALFDAQRRILCVRLNYAHRGWTTPGGRLEPGESPIDACVRETLEETGYRIEVTELVGTYASSFKDDLVLQFEGTILDREAWEPGGEIAEVGFFSRDELPIDRYRTRTRVMDAFDGRRGVFRVFEGDAPPE